MKHTSKHIIKTQLKCRDEFSSKFNFGHALLIAGNTGKMGAAIIAAKACLRSGCGLLTVSVPENEVHVLQTSLPESMVSIRENDEDHFNKFNAAGIGPGIGTSKTSIEILIYLMAEFKKPIVIDADALNIIASNKYLLKQMPENTILTPHAKEFDRLFGVHKTTEHRILTAIEKAMQYNIIIVLKSHQTLIAQNGISFLNSTGNAGLAKAGSGDALTGMITAFLAQGYKPFEAAQIAVFLHGFAADIALKKQSLESMLITDVIECIGKAFKAILK